MRSRTQTHQQSAPHPTPDISIVMPCLDEAITLPGCIRMAQEALQMLDEDTGLQGEIVISDNGSTDGSQSIATSMGARVVNCPTRGYGHALRYGIEQAQGRYVVMGDSDGSYDFRESVPMVKHLNEGYDLCMGSRFKGEIKPGAMPWKNKYIGNPILTGILNMFFRTGMSDAHSGLRAFTKDAYLQISPTSTGMEFASELVVKSSLLDLKRTEVPITLHPDGRNRPPHLRPWRDGWRHLRYLLMLSPLWLFLVPALLLGATGLGIFTTLLLTPADKVASMGNFWMGDHWMVLAASFVTMGHLLLLLGLSSTLVGLRDGYRKATFFLRSLYKMSRLENLLVLGAFFFLSGLGVLTYIAWVWASHDYGNLVKIREMVLAATLITLGLQSMFGGFLLSILAGNEAQLEKTVESAQKQHSQLLQTPPQQLLL